jgi:hypothetical protein
MKPQEQKKQGNNAKEAEHRNTLSKWLLIFLGISAVVFLVLAVYVILLPDPPETIAVFLVTLSVVCAILPTIIQLGYGLTLENGKIVFAPQKPDSDEPSSLTTDDIESDDELLPPATCNDATGVEVIKTVVNYLFDQGALNRNKFLNNIQYVDALTLECIYYLVEGWRMVYVYELINKATNSDIQVENRKNIGKLEVVFSALFKARSPSPNLLHNYYSRLAFVQKDGPKPKYLEAFNNIKEAIHKIESIGTDHEKKTYLPLYKFNRLICGLNVNDLSLYSDADKEKDYNYVLQHDMEMLFTTEDIIAPKLYAWIDQDEKRRQDHQNWKNQEQAKQTN